MQYKKGLLVLKPLRSFGIESGTLGIINVDNEKHIVTLEYVENTTNSWYVSGNTYSGLVPEDLTIYTLQADVEDSTYPVGISSWRRIIANDLINLKSYIDLVITPHKFKPGKYAQTCSECMSSFLGSKTQPICQKCCEINSTASIDTTKVKRKRIVRRTQVNVTEAKEIALEAYDLGLSRTDADVFLNWLNNKLKKHGNNSSKEG